MRMESILKICNVLHITPDEIFTGENTNIDIQQSEIIEKLNSCSPKNKETALQILSVFLNSLD